MLGVAVSSLPPAPLRNLGGGLPKIYFKSAIGSFPLDVHLQINVSTSPTLTTSFPSLICFNAHADSLVKCLPSLLTTSLLAAVLRAVR